jgi:hypothetical protein
MIPLNVLVRAALAEVISNRKNNMLPLKWSLNPGSNCTTWLSICATMSVVRSA